jgi:hypothetical protein
LITLACLIFGPSHFFGLDTHQENLNECEDKKILCNYYKVKTPQECEQEFVDCKGDITAGTYSTLIVSLIMLGAASGSVVVPILLELVQSIKDAVGARPGANEKGSAFFTMGRALGSIAGNWIGGFLYKKYKNPITCDIMAALAFSMGIIYFGMNIWPGCLIKKK